MSAVKIGSNVNCWCTRCKMILAHTTEAVVGSEIKRVACNTCHGKHTYRPNAPGTSTAATRASKAGGSKVSANPGRGYATLMENKDSAKAESYQFQTRYLVGSMLKHTDFGVGVVTADKGGNKIEVMFETGSKVLVHGR
ncbi:MAG: hypothetical protein V4534_01815 [Myxococcota bacterium]